MSQIFKRESVVVTKLRENLVLISKEEKSVVVTTVSKILVLNLEDSFKNECLKMTFDFKNHIVSNIRLKLSSKERNATMIIFTLLNSNVTVNFISESFVKSLQLKSLSERSIKVVDVNETTISSCQVNCSYFIISSIDE